MSDMNIAEFETALREMKKKLESNLERLHGEMEAITTDDEIEDMQDMASLASDSMHHAALLKQQEHELGEVVHALAKIQNGTYGICEKTGKSIPVARLRAEPHARYSVEAAKEMER